MIDCAARAAVLHMRHSPSRQPLGEFPLPRPPLKWSPGGCPLEKMPLLSGEPGAAAQKEGGEESRSESA